MHFKIDFVAFVQFIILVIISQDKIHLFMINPDSFGKKKKPLQISSEIFHPDLCNLPNEWTLLIYDKERWGQESPSSHILSSKSREFCFNCLKLMYCKQTFTITGHKDSPSVIYAFGDLFQGFIEVYANF